MHPELNPNRREELVREARKGENVTDTFAALLDEPRWVERLGGLCRVSLIYVRPTGQPQFCMSAERHSDPDNGPMSRPIHIRQSIGNGARRRPAGDECP
jgi:hypothetical protein